MPVNIPKVKLPLSVVIPDSAAATNTVPERGNWGSKTEFVLSCIGMSVGMGNVWRFPYMAYSNGGAAFVIPYVILLLLIGKPMYFAECAIGQFSSLGPITVYRCCPAMKGVGVASTLISLFVALYYNMYIVYSMLYLFFCFYPTPPWSECAEWWGATEECYMRGQNLDLPMCSDLESVTGGPAANISEGETCRYWATSGQQFWTVFILNMRNEHNLENIGTIQWKIVLTLIISWILIFLCIGRGIKSTGKVVYVTAIFPYVILFTLLVVGLTMEGAMKGVHYLFLPKWEAMFDIGVWRKAASQMFFSLNVAYGGIIMFSSYNRFENNIKRDAILVSTMDTFTSLIASVAIFSIAGNMAHRLNLPIEKVADTGPGLAFEIVPEALLTLPVPQIWCALFFIMLIFLGIDSEFAYVETFLTGLYDEIPALRKHKILNCMAVCTVCCLIAISFTTQGGSYILDYIDQFATGTGVLLLAVFELATFMWIYGLRNFLDDTEFMLGSRPNYYWRICWCILDPFILSVMFILTMAEFEAKDFKQRPYPLWALILGWCLALTSLLQVPIWMAYAIITYKKKGKSVWDAFRPTETWGPTDPAIRIIYRQWKNSTPPPGTERRNPPKLGGLEASQTTGIKLATQTDL